MMKPLPSHHLLREALFRRVRGWYGVDDKTHTMRVMFGSACESILRAFTTTVFPL